MAAMEDAISEAKTAKGFDAVQGRGRALHSKLQDARKGQLDLHAFQMKTQVGGSIIKKYEGESAKLETFIDARWHRELKVKVQEDLWVLRDADMEATQVLSDWRKEQWTASKAHDLHRWDAQTLQSFLKSLDLPGEVRIPSTMTGSQLRRLGPRGLAALCGDVATAQVLQAALLGERQADQVATAAHRSQNARMTALGNHKVHAADYDVDWHELRQAEWMQHIQNQYFSRWSVDKQDDAWLCGDSEWPKLAKNAFLNGAFKYGRRWPVYSCLTGGCGAICGQNKQSQRG
eukprot:g12941.t1